MCKRMSGVFCAAAVGCAILTGCRSGSGAADAGVSLDRRIETGGWTVLADVPEPRLGGAAAVVDDKLHLFGGVNMNPHTPEGQDKARAVNLHHIYDPATDTWSAGALMPDKKGWPANPSCRA